MTADSFTPLTETPPSSQPASEPTCGCEGLWHDLEISIGPEARDSYSRTGHLPNCPVPALPDSDTRWYCPDCDEHHATAELTATPESHQPACPDCGHEVEMEWTDKDFVVPDSDTLPPSETPEVTDVAPAVREEAVRTAARVRDRAKAGEYEMGALDAAVLARGVLLLDAALTCATTSPKVSAASELERLKEDSLKCTICGEPKICANGGCIGDD